MVSITSQKYIIDIPLIRISGGKKKMIAPKDVYDKFLLRIKTLTEDELKEFIEKAKKMGISEKDIEEGLKAIKSLK